MKVLEFGKLKVENVLKHYLLIQILLVQFILIEMDLLWCLVAMMVYGSI